MKLKTLIALSAIISIPPGISLLASQAYAGSHPHEGGVDHTTDGGSASHEEATIDHLSSLSGDAYDDAFIEHMIPHHQGAIDVASLSAGRARHQEIVDLSAEIIAAQELEIQQMTEWHEEFGFPAHDGELPEHIQQMIEHSEEAVAHLSTLSGDAYDKAFIEHMVPHHQFAIDITSLSPDRANHQEIFDISIDIITSQQAEIDLMTSLYEEWCYGEFPSVDNNDNDANDMNQDVDCDGIEDWEDDDVWVDDLNGDGIHDGCPVPDENHCEGVVIPETDDGESTGNTDSTHGDVPVDSSGDQTDGANTDANEDTGVEDGVDHSNPHSPSADSSFSSANGGGGCSLSAQRASNSAGGLMTWILGAMGILLTLRFETWWRKTPSFIRNHEKIFPAGHG